MRDAIAKGNVPKLTDDEVDLLVRRPETLAEVTMAIQSPLYDGSFITITGKLSNHVEAPPHRYYDAAHQPMACAPVPSRA